MVPHVMHTRIVASLRSHVAACAELQYQYVRGRLAVLTILMQVRQHAEEAGVGREASSKLAAMERRAADLQAEAQR